MISADLIEVNESQLIYMTETPEEAKKILRSFGIDMLSERKHSDDPNCLIYGNLERTDAAIKKAIKNEGKTVFLVTIYKDI